MPEMWFTVRWPDQSLSECYSPSTVITHYFACGEKYQLMDFVTRSHTALTAASERVRATHGFACSSALDQLRKIQHTAERFRDQPDAQVIIERITGR